MSSPLRCVKVEVLYNLVVQVDYLLGLCVAVVLGMCLAGDRLWHFFVLLLGASVVLGWWTVVLHIKVNKKIVKEGLRNDRQNSSSGKNSL